MKQRQVLHDTSLKHNSHPNPTGDSGTKYNSSNKKLTSLIATQNLVSNRPFTLVNIPHPAYHRHSPCLLTNSLPHPTPYSISHYPSHYRSAVPQSPYHSMLFLNYTTSTSSIPTRSLYLPQTSIHSHLKHTIILFPASSSPLNPTPTSQYPGWVPANDTKGHNYE